MLEFRTEKTKDTSAVVVGLFAGEKRAGCAWETTVVPGLFNWSLFAVDGDGSVAQGSGYEADGYSMEKAMRELVAAYHNAKVQT